MAIDTKKRETLLAILTAVILGAIFIFVLLIDPQIKKHKILSSRFASLKVDLTKAKGNLLIKDRIEKAYSQIGPLITVEGTAQQQISGFTRLLDQLYSKLNVKIRSVKILPVTNENYYQKISIRIEMVTSVKDFLSFIEAVEQHQDPIRIEQFELASQDSKDVILASLIISKIVSGEAMMAGKR